LFYNFTYISISFIYYKVEYETDKKIQQIIKEYFSNSTIVIVAHRFKYFNLLFILWKLVLRLSTIIDADFVYVIDDGHLVESGEPSVSLI
jgi:ABC-type multidrug transport system fused ATPase/permease subunit